MPASKIVIIGSGFAGLCMAIRLKQAGIEDFLLLERAGEVGGTWRENTYPGAACDVPSHVYSYSFAPSSKWSRKFAPQAEIFAYLRECVDRFKVREQLRLNHTVEAMEYLEAQGLWRIKLKDQPEVLEARFVVLASGGLSRPAWPDIPGRESFQGALFHTAAWRHDYDLHGKRIAVIGTGASAIQVVPALAQQVKQLTLFQRTPAWILPKDDFAFSPKTRERFRSWPLLGKLFRTLLYWQFEFRALALLNPKLMARGEELARAYIKDSIKDPTLREHLTPKYTMGCKRILLSNEFYPAMNLPQVNLETKGIERITERGIMTKDGIEHEYDAIVCATGFQVAEASAPFLIKGRQEKILSEEWKDGAEAYLGTAVHGFPNLFFLIGPNTGLGHNSIIFIIESQVTYVLDALKRALRRQIKSLEVKAERQASYNESLQQRFQSTVWAPGLCQSWYQNAKGRNVSLWPGYSFELRLKTRHFDAKSYKLEVS